MWEVGDWGYHRFFTFPLNDIQDTENKTIMSTSLNFLLYIFKLFLVSDVNCVQISTFSEVYLLHQEFWTTRDTVLALSDPEQSVH